VLRRTRAGHAQVFYPERPGAMAASTRIVRPLDQADRGALEAYILTELKRRELLP
jgi:hypothetical protein